MSTLGSESVNFHGRIASSPASSRALVRLAQKRLRDSWLDRVASLLGACLVLAGGVLVYVGSGSEALEVGELVMRVLVVASWSAGLVAALAAARPFADKDTREGVLRMMAVRGVEPGRLASAYAIATVLRIAVAVAVPALALWVLGLALSSSPSGLLGRALLGGAILIYTLVFATVLGLVARWVTAWLPTRPRTLFLAVLAVPYLMSLIWPAIPSLPELSFGLAGRLTNMALGGL